MEFWIALAIAFVWLVIVSLLLFKYIRHYNKFLGRGEKGKLSSLLEDIFKRGKLEEEKRQELEKQIKNLEKDAQSHIQKLGFLRYNPFSDTGGDQSFVLAFLDNNDTGIVITSLHTRGTTRWYAKRLIKGKSENYKLSEEEKRAVEMARKKGRKK